jgi:hypothetical protein
MPAYQATNRPGFRCDFALANRRPRLVQDADTVSVSDMSSPAIQRRFPWFRLLAKDQDSLNQIAGEQQRISPCNAFCRGSFSRHARRRAEPYRPGGTNRVAIGAGGSTTTPSIWISCRLRQSGSGKARKVGSPPSGRLAQQSLGGADHFIRNQGHSPSRASRSALHWRVANLERRGHIEAIETAPQASALGAELTNLDPIAFRNISGQRKRGRTCGRRNRR